jgi:hypothetical protein
MQIRHALKIAWTLYRMFPSEIQKINQDEYDVDFANQVYHGKMECDLAYKKGFSDGAKWCVNRFFSSLV